MKSEETAQAIPTTQTTYSTQWATPSMAIDPALQQQTTAAQYYSAYTSHYPQTAYATHYQPYAPPMASGSAAQQPKPIAAAPAHHQTNSYNTATAGNAMDTSDINTLKDALGSAGVDLRAEEESLQRTQSDSAQQAYRSFDDRTRKQPPKPSFDTRILGATMRTIGTNHKISRIPEDSVSYLALSLRARLQDLVTAMIAAGHHRTDITFDRPATLYEDNSPMWSIVIKSDVAKQLAALEKVDREEETKIRKERKDRADLQAAHAAVLAAQANGASSAAGMGLGGGIAGGMGDGAGGALGGDEQDGLGGSGKKKRKKDGPGVTARNMSEDARKKMSNAVATQAAGLGGKYAWMTAANSASATPPKPKQPAVAVPVTSPAATAATATVSPTTTTGTPAALASTGASSSWARPYIPTTKKNTTSREEMLEHDTRTTITMRDAMFVIEKERGHGGGRGAARGWT